jgi:hypothetical protein
MILARVQKAQWAELYTVTRDIWPDLTTTGDAILLQIKNRLVHQYLHAVGGAELLALSLLVQGLGFLVAAEGYLLVVKAFLEIELDQARALGQLLAAVFQ